MRRALRSTALVALLAASGCSYDSPEQGPVIVNSCSMGMNDCASGAECMNGMCIWQEADDELTIALEVTPLRQPDGSDPLPIVVAPFKLKVPTQRTIELPESKELHGYVRSMSATGGEVPLEADVSFTQIDTIRGISSKVITVASTPTPGRATSDADFVVRLLNGRSYRMVVRPRDPNLPPRYEMVEGGGPDPRVEYPAPGQLYKRRVVVKGAPAASSVRVRALSIDGAEPISSTATLDSHGVATLGFLELPESFTLEIRSEATYTASKPSAVASNDTYCDNNTPNYPVFTAKSNDLPVKDDALQVALPTLPQHIMFEGYVKLCASGLEQRAPLDNLAISLHTADLLPDDDVLAASFEASTTATDDMTPQDRSLHFCVQVIPGQHYDLVAAPASSMPCALLNEPRTVAAPAGATSAGPVDIMLPDAAYLSATLRTMDNTPTPLRGAAIDAIALGGKETRYNRSRPTSTDADGSFKLQVDLGTYDVVIKPASGSGLPWHVRHNVTVGKADELATAIDMYLPVTLDGSLRYDDANAADASLKDAVVAAYAVIKDGDGERAVPIGSATADANGRFVLLLPPVIEDGWW